MNKSIVKSKTTHFLIGSFICLLIFSVVIFLALGIYMSHLNEQTINAVGNLYMTGMSYSQIARVLGRDEKATDNALQRLKSKIRKML